MAALIEFLIALLKGLPILNSWFNKTPIDKKIAANAAIDKEEAMIKKGAPPEDTW